MDHLLYSTKLKMANELASNLKCPDTKRKDCLACAQGKQSKKLKSPKDSGSTSIIEVIGELSVSTLNVP